MDVTNSVNENGNFKKVPFFDHNYVNKNPDKNNYATNHLPLIINQSSLTDKNNSKNTNSEIKSKVDNTCSKNLTYRLPNSSKQNIFNMEGEFDNTIDKFNKLKIGNEKQGNTNFYKKRNDFATVFDEKREDKKTDFIYDRGFKSKYDKSNIFF